MAVFGNSFWEFLVFFAVIWQFAGPGSQEEVWGATSFYASYLYLPSHLFSPCLLVGGRTIPPFFIPAGGAKRLVVLNALSPLP